MLVDGQMPFPKVSSANVSRNNSITKSHNYQTTNPYTENETHATKLARPQSDIKIRKHTNSTSSLRQPVADANSRLDLKMREITPSYTKHVNLKISKDGKKAVLPHGHKRSLSRKRN